MNDRDNLRARIENTLAQAGARGKDKAQAVIDDLGLTTEWCYGFEGQDARYPLDSLAAISAIGMYGRVAEAVIESRIVGKWVEQ